MRLVSVDPDQTMPLSLKLFSRATGETRFVGAHVLDDERVTIGRSKECTLNLHDPERLLSRVQAELVRAADGYLLKVASSHTPVAVNGKDYPPGSEVMVGVGDTVTMDVHDIEIVSVAADEPAKPAPAPVRETAPQPRRVIPLSVVQASTPEMHRKPVAHFAKWAAIIAATVLVLVSLFVLWQQKYGGR